jgi:hypothetical protein
MNGKASRDPDVRRRQMLAASLLILTMAALAALEAFANRGDPLRPIDGVRIGAIMLLALILALRSTTNFTLMRRNPALDDELARANRASAATWGFWAFIMALIAAVAANLFWPLGLSETALAILVSSVAAAAARFIALERSSE